MGFLQDNGLDLQAIDAQALLETFLDEMGAGLRGEGSLPMIPSDLHLPEGAIRDAEFPAFDVGGTNIRSARVRFGSSGAPTVEGLQRGFMPGSRGHVTHAEFYRILCAVLTGNLRPGETLGYCFSYPVDEGGRLLYWTKGIQADDIVGSDVRDDLAAALAERGLPGCRVRILNDTVAALLAAYAHGGTGDYAGVVGFILGTGTMTSESVSAALAIAWYCREPMRCAKLCANLGGDTDTIGAMATAICGAAVGLDAFDPETVRYLEETNGLDFRAMAERIVALRGEFRLGGA